MEIRALRTAADLHRYLDFAADVYRGNPYWLPPDAHHMVETLGGTSAAAVQSRIQPFAAERDGRIVATVAAVRDQGYVERWNEALGHLLFFEALANEEDAVHALIETACSWLREQGCQAARMSMLPGWQLPFTIDAYDQVPTFFHSYNPAYYHNYAKNSRFVTEHGVVQYQVTFTADLERRYREMVANAEGRNVRLRTWDFDRLAEETVLFTEIFNETFASHWGFMPLPTGVMEGLTVGLKDYLIPEFTVFAEVDGAPAGFVYALPDLNQAFHRMSSDGDREQFDRLFRQIDHGILLIIGVRQAHRGRGINLAMAARSYLAMMARGYKTGSYTVVLDDNWPSRRTAEKLGCKVIRNFVVYRKELG
jgi:hypothetical protein